MVWGQAILPILLAGIIPAITLRSKSPAAIVMGIVASLFTIVVTCPLNVVLVKLAAQKEYRTGDVVLANEASPVYSGDSAVVRSASYNLLRL